MCDKDHTNNVTLTLNDKKDEESVTDGSTADIEDDNVEMIKDDKSRKKRKLKKKKIYFRSDFVGDASSSDEEQEKPKKSSPTICDENPADLSWVMWFWYYIVVASMSTFHGAEFCGEKLADFFGITSPKYQYAINEYHRLKEEEREEEERERREAECVRQRELDKLSHLETGVEKPPDVNFTPDA